MKTLIVEDDVTSRLLLQEIMKDYGPVHIAANGKEAVEKARVALEEKEPYDLICMDIMMPEMDGQEALRRIRELEKNGPFLPSAGTKIVMTTAVGGLRDMYTAFGNLCDAYLVKPIDKSRLLAELRKLDLISGSSD